MFSRGSFGWERLKDQTFNVYWQTKGLQMACLAWPSQYVNRYHTSRVSQDGVIGATDFVSGKILSVFSLGFLFYQQATLISVMSRFLTVVARQLWSVDIRVCVILAQSVDF